VRPELDLVEDEDQITHEMSLEDKHDPQATLNVFKWVGRAAGGKGGGGEGGVREVV
jgi:hypothetical protein